MQVYRAGVAAVTGAAGHLSAWTSSSSVPDCVLRMSTAQMTRSIVPGSSTPTTSSCLQVITVPALAAGKTHTIQVAKESQSTDIATPDCHRLDTHERGSAVGCDYAIKTTLAARLLSLDWLPAAPIPHEQGRQQSLLIPYCGRCDDTRNGKVSLQASILCLGHQTQENHDCPDRLRYREAWAQQTLPAS